MDSTTKEERELLQWKAERDRLAEARSEKTHADFNEALRLAGRAEIKRRDAPVTPRALERWQIVRAFRKDLREGSLLYGKRGQQLRAGSVPSVAKRLSMTKTDLIRARRRLGLAWPPVDGPEP